MKNRCDSIKIEKVNGQPVERQCTQTVGHIETAESAPKAEWWGKMHSWRRPSHTVLWPSR